MLGPTVVSSGMYSTFVDFERTTLYKLRRKLLGDFRTFVLSLVEKLAAEEAERRAAEEAEREKEAEAERQRLAAEEEAERLRIEEEERKRLEEEEAEMERQLAERDAAAEELRLLLEGPAEEVHLDVLQVRCPSVASPAGPRANARLADCVTMRAAD